MPIKNILVKVALGAQEVRQVEVLVSGVEVAVTNMEAEAEAIQAVMETDKAVHHT